MARNRRKSSRAANLFIRINRIANGMKQAGPEGPVIIVKDRKLVKFTREEYARLEEKAESLSYFAGYQILPELLIK